MADLTAYFDESGTHGADYVVIAGFLGNTSAWNSLTERWTSALKDHNIPFLRLSGLRRRRNFSPEAPGTALVGVKVS